MIEGGKQQMIALGNDWDELLKDEFNKPYYLKLRQFLKNEYQTKTVFPDMYDIFNSLKHTSYQDVKVVILGQDPYHGRDQAHGFSFSVQKGVQIPPSLQNIYLELKNDLNCDIPNNGYLIPWADQGVLLLNTVLTGRQCGVKPFLALETLIYQCFWCFFFSKKQTNYKTNYNFF